MQNQVQLTEIQEYAKYIGVNFPEEEYMWELAKEGVTASLPPGWEACQTPDGELVYRNMKLKVIQQQHPMDQIYRQRVTQLRQQYKKYQQQQQQSQNNSQLNTIPQQKSSQKSLASDSQLQLDQLMMPSKQFFMPSQTLRQSDNGLNQGMLAITGTDYSVSSQIGLAKESLRIGGLGLGLGEDRSGSGSGKIGVGFKEKELFQQQHRKQKLKLELQYLKNEQKLAQQLLLQLQKDNERRSKKLKQKLLPKKSPNSNSIPHPHP